ncbi:ricin B lectin domain-containing protein [Zopfochytrium polystomum]|nr:ricin B lectin domain-containing protein [Zopfochytrium polystomum]
MIKAAAILVANLLIHARLAKAVNWSPFGGFYLANCQSNPIYSLVGFTRNQGDDQPLDDAYTHGGSFITGKAARKPDAQSQPNGATVGSAVFSYSPSREYSLTCIKNDGHQISASPIEKSCSLIYSCIPNKFTHISLSNGVSLAKGQYLALNLVNPSVDSALNFAFLPTPNNSFVITDGDGLCVTVTGNRIDNLAPVALFPCSGTKTAYNQQWIPVPTSGGGFFLKGVQSGRCLNDKGAAGAAGDSLILWDCDFDTQPASNIWLSTKSCWGLLLWEWTFISKSGGFGILHNASGLCLDVYGAGTGNGNGVDFWDCNYTDNQLWYLSTAGAGNVGGFAIISKASGRCLNVYGGNYVGGAPIAIYDCVAGDLASIWNLQSN